jgi:hypothetical protein
MAMRARKTDISSLTTFDAAFEEYAAAQRREAREAKRLEACIGRSDYSYDEVVKMIQGKRRTPLSVKMSIETALAIGRRGAAIQAQMAA